jgi:hypothetical protein
MSEQTTDEWFRTELQKLMCRYESKMRSERIKRGIRRKKTGVVPNSPKVYCHS